MIYYKNTAQDIVVANTSITEHVFANLLTRLDDVVLIDGPTGNSFTARDFMDQVKRLAGGLVEKGFGQGRTIALMAPNSPEYCIIFHAVAWAGGTITTINPTYTEAELHHQLNDSGADLLITLPSFLEVAQKGAAGTNATQIVTIGEADGVASLAAFYGEPLKDQVPVDLNTHSVVLPYSSGTTGLPKGVKLSHRNLVVNVQQTASGADFQTGEVAAAFLPFFHIYGMNVLMNVHLGCGGVLVTMPRFDLEQFLTICQDHKSRRMWIVPPVALALAKHPMIDEYDLSSVDQVFSGAAPMGAELSDAVAARLNCAMLQGFGMTELAPVSHVTPLSGPRAGSSGIAVPNTDCRIVDPETGEDLPTGEEGELWIKGPQVMIGYLNNDTATQETITNDGYLKTGDIAKIDADGYMFIVDRLKELIKYNGFQVAPAELESLLTSHSGITDAAVIGMPDEAAGEVPVAFVVAGDPGPSEQDVKDFIAGKLAHYKHLHHVTFVTEIPKSASGKILRRLLRQQIS